MTRILLPDDEETAQVLLAASAQLGLALRESQGPVAELGALFTRVTERLARAAGGRNAGERELLAQIQSKVFHGVEQLQFYDRLVQHLTHIEQYLIGLAIELGSARSESRLAPALHELTARLRMRLISDEQRGLLDLFLSPQTTTRVSAQAHRIDYSPPGSFEMF